MNTNIANYKDEVRNFAEIELTKEEYEMYDKVAELIHEIGIKIHKMENCVNRIELERKIEAIEDNMYSLAYDIWYDEEQLGFIPSSRFRRQRLKVFVDNFKSSCQNQLSNEREVNSMVYVVWYGYEEDNFSLFSKEVALKVAAELSKVYEIASVTCGDKIIDFFERGYSDNDRER